MELRPYQNKLISETRQALGMYRRVIVQSPTGSGKGVILGAIVDMCLKKGSRTLVVCHRLEIVKQDARQIEKFTRSEPEIISPKQRRMPMCTCCVAMAQTLRRRVEKEEWAKWLSKIKLLIIDEAHTSEMNFLFDYISSDCYVIGLTASPARYGQQRQLGLDYKAIVTGPTVKQLIEWGNLCRCRLYSLDAPSMDGVEWDYGRGDYSLKQMRERFMSSTRYVGAVDNYMRICPGEKTVVFCCSSEQTIEVTKAFNERGVNAKYLLSNSFDDDEDYSGERDEVMAEFERGEFKVLVNFGLFTTGLDQPDIKVVILLFSTTSIVKYLQCLGRASRPAEGKNGEFICLDFGCNYERLGRYEDDRTWGVWHNTGAGGGVAPVKECPQCHKLVAVQYQDCPFCGYHWPTQQETYKAELYEIVAGQDTAKMSFEQDVANKKLKGWKNDWILRDVCQRYPDNQKEYFMRAIEILRKEGGGEKLSPSYWHFFKEHKLGKVRHRDEGAKLL